MKTTLLLFLITALNVSYESDLDQLISGTTSRIVRSQTFTGFIQNVRYQQARECPEMVVLFFSSSGKRIAAEPCSTAGIGPSSKTWLQKLEKGQVICILMNSVIYTWTCQ